jgi:hypothetical protein
MQHSLKRLVLTLGLLALLAVPALAQDDGRLNAATPDAPVILYCSGDNYVFIDRQNGQSVGSVARSSVPSSAAEAVVLASTARFDLYYAPQGFLQFEAPTGVGTKYVYRWPGDCVPRSGSSSFEAGAAGLSLPVGGAATTVETTTTTPAPVSRSGVINLSDLPVIGPSASIDPSEIDLRRDGYGITNFDILTLRTGAGAQYQRLALVEGGVFVTVTGRNEADTWLRVETATGVAGWLRANSSGEGADDFVIRRGNLSGIPVIPLSEMGALAPATLVISLAQPLHATASTDTVLCNVAAGEYIINGSNRDGDWYQLSAACVDGSAVTGWVEELAGALRNPPGGLVPILDDGLEAADGLQFVEGPSFVFFLPRQLYVTPSLDADFVCEAAPNRYPIIGRNASVSWYEITAVCADGSTAIGWLQSIDGLFQTTNNATVPVTG